MSEGTTNSGEPAQAGVMEMERACGECVRVIEDALAGRPGARVGDAVAGCSDAWMGRLGAGIDGLIAKLEADEARSREYHAATMNLAIGMSECFQVLSEVAQGNLSARVNTDGLGSHDELSVSLATAINDTIEKFREQLETIQRQRSAIQELSTPVLELWDSVLALPIIGVVDTSRASEIMERLLSAISEKQARCAILDITGVDIVDTRIADHFIKVVKAAELLGVRCIITGIRPAVAQTLVEIGVDLSSITTRRTLREGFRECLRFMRQSADLALAGGAAAIATQECNR